MAVRTWEEKEGEGECKNQISHWCHHRDKGGPHKGQRCQMLQSHNINLELGGIHSSEDQLSVVVKFQEWWRRGNQVSKRVMQMLLLMRMKVMHSPVLHASNGGRRQRWPERRQRV